MKDATNAERYQCWVDDDEMSLNSNETTKLLVQWHNVGTGNRTIGSGPISMRLKGCMMEIDLRKVGPCVGWMVERMSWWYIQHMLNHTSC